MFISAADLYNLLAVRYVREVAAGTKTIASLGDSGFTCFDNTLITRNQLQFIRLNFQTTAGDMFIT